MSLLLCADFRLVLTITRRSICHIWYRVRAIIRKSENSSEVIAFGWPHGFQRQITQSKPHRVILKKFFNYLIIN